MSDKAAAVYRAMGGIRYFTHRDQATGDWGTYTSDRAGFWVISVDDGVSYIHTKGERKPLERQANYSLEFCEDAVARGSWVEIKEEEVDEICSGRREKRRSETHQKS